MPRDVTPMAWRLACCAPLALWALWCLAHGERRWEHVVVSLLMATVATRQRNAALFWGLFPLLTLGLLNDWRRFLPAADPAHVHLCDVRALEVRLFGRPGSNATLHDGLQAHATRTFDLLCAVPYGAYLYVVVGYAYFAYRRNAPSMAQFSSAVLCMSLAAMLTYDVFPVAPPWYYHRHGCDILAGAQAYEGANLARVDAWMGTHYFAALYGRSVDVHGAMPSLHVSFMGAIAWHLWPRSSYAARLFSLLLTLWMATAAVYLDHHWVLDVLAGLAYVPLGFYAQGLFHELLRRPWGRAAPIG
jgi:membrane-associated phospholipid phosphatase